MKIFVLSDPHGNGQIVKETLEEVNSGDYEVFLGLGDFVSKRLFSELVVNLQVERKSFIQGNRDFRLRGLPYLKKWDKFDYDGLRFILIGFHHTPRVKEKIMKDCEAMEGKELVMASHEPPFRVRDETHSGARVGVPKFREVIKEKQPLAWLCGHIHEGEGVSTVGNTKVVNAAASKEVLGYRVVVEDEKIKDIERLVR